MTFDESKDGVDRCSDFMTALGELMKEHRVIIAGHVLNLTQVEMVHDDDKHGWRLDLRDTKDLTDGKAR